MITEEQINHFVEFLNSTYGNEHRLYKVAKLIKRYRIILYNYTSTSVYCFVDFDGNIYKYADWNRPAKGIRGHINLPQECCEKYSVKYNTPGRKKLILN